MTDRTPDGGGPQPRPEVGRGVRLAVWSAVAVGVAAALYVMAGALFKPADRVTTARGPAGVSGSIFSAADAEARTAALGIPPLKPKGQGEPAPATPFKDAHGHEVRLADLKGHVVLLNLWATWCAPCRKEMPTFARLQAVEAARGLKVVPVSIDKASDTDKARAFIAANAPLAFYQDPSLTLPFSLKPPAQGFPTTVIYDKSGRERARALSDQDWSSDRVRRIVEKLAAE